MVTLFTRRDYEALPDGYPAQLIEGCLVKDAAPAVGHQVCQLDVVDALRDFVPRGQLLVAPTDVLVDELNVFQPDIVVLARPPRDLTSPYVGTPLAVFEILSPSTAKRDRGFKVRRLLGRSRSRRHRHIERKPRLGGVRRRDRGPLARHRIAGAESAESR